MWLCCWIENKWPRTCSWNWRAQRTTPHLYLVQKQEFLFLFLFLFQFLSQCIFFIKFRCAKVSHYLPIVHKYQQKRTAGGNHHHTKICIKVLGRLKLFLLIFSLCFLFLLSVTRRLFLWSVLNKSSTKNNVTKQPIMNFVWSLKPIFISLAIYTGVDIDRSKKKKNVRRWFLRIYCFLLLIFYISCSTIKIASKITSLESHQTLTNHDEESIISLWNRKITRILTYILLIAFYLLAFVSAFLKWKPLWKKIKLVELNLNYPTSCYRRLRRETFVGLLLLSMVIFGHSSDTVLVWNQILWFNQDTTVA